MTTTRDRLIDAAFSLFDERGFEATTVDDVAARAGLGRTTFFRTFKSKEDVIFPDHDVVLRAVRDRLDTATTSTALVAVTEATGLVLAHYVAEGSRARQRYALTRTVPALRDREITGQRQYQDTFRTFLHRWMGETPETALRSALMANAVVTAHNHVLRRWLRGTTDDRAATDELARAMTDVVALFEHTPGQEGEASLVVLRTTRALTDILPALRELADPVVLDADLAADPVPTRPQEEEHAP